MDILKEAMEIETKLRCLEKKIDLNYQNLTFALLETFKRESEKIDDAKKRFFKELKNDDEVLKMSQKINIMLLKELVNICDSNNIMYWLDFGTLLGAIRHNGFVPWDDDIDISICVEDLSKLQNVVEKSNKFKLWSKYIVDTQCCRVTRFFSAKYNIPNFIDIFVYYKCKSSSDKVWNEYRVQKQNFSDLLKKHTFVFCNDDIPYFNDPLYKKALTMKCDIDYVESIISHNMAKLCEFNDEADDECESYIWGIDNFNFFQGKKCVFLKNDIFPLKKEKFEDGLFSIPFNSNYILAQKYGDIFTLPNDMISHKHFGFSEAILNEYYEILRRNSF